ncbi:acyl-homoserine-lactone synthase [Hydrogenimonas urashimensis]|uniref:acyl-homoserine-lactone synthase n=1 Tax=Hydrogenimonas urashimensis TaxID=2740515 RepID=UPI001915D214|nr:GNAT family N-acyltransferase [Hydrogenimonas urashimensis]
MKIVKAETEELLRKIYRLRYEVLCKEIKTLDKSHYPDGLEKDRYDAYADHFAVLDEKGEMVGCFRLIYRSPIGFPTLNVMEMNDLLEEIPAEKLCEISRITVDRRYRSIQTAIKIFKLIMLNGCPLMKREGMEYLLCAVEGNFYRLLRIANVPFEIIGEPKKYLERYRYPALMSMEKLARKNPKYCKYR